MDLNGKMYQYKAHVGSGNYGHVYLFEDPLSKHQFVAKIEKKNPNGRQQFILTKESYYLRTLQKEDETKDKIPHTPKWLGEGFHDDC